MNYLRGAGGRQHTADLLGDKKKVNLSQKGMNLLFFAKMKNMERCWVVPKIKTDNEGKANHLGENKDRGPESI